VRIINKKIIKMVRFTSSKETGTVRCTKCGGLVSGELQYTGDNYCKGHKTEQLNTSHVNNLAKFSQKIAKQSDCPPEFIEIVNKEFWNLI
jgi:hypothetical protein